MPQTTTHLALPLIAAAQAGKHVTHNEALVGLDALVQLACLDKDLAAPPANPAEGDRYLVTAPNPTGAWTGLSGQVALYQDGAWTGLPPRAGWLAYLVDEAELYLFGGTAWIGFRTTLTALQNLAQLGIGTSADATNRLAVKSEAALFSWDEATPGSGSMRQTINKKAPENDAGLIFQTGFSTRALFGLIGSDRIGLKVSPDGASYAQAFTVDPTTGCLGLSLTTNPAAGLHLTTVRAGSGAGVAPQDVQVDSFGGDALGAVAPGAAFVGRAARGVPGNPAPIRATDRVTGFFGAGWRGDGAYSGNVVAFQGMAEEDFTATGNGTSLDIETTALGATVRRPVARFRANGTLELRPQASPPTQGLAPGQVVFDSTAGAFKGYDGLRWARLTNAVCFSAYTNFDNYVPANAWTKVQVNVGDANDQGAFAAGSNRFTAPEGGLYAFAASLAYKRNGSSAPTAFEAQFYKNGVPAGRGRAAVTGSLTDGISALSLATSLKLAAGDAIEVFVRFTGADGYVAAADSLFSGRQLS